MSTAIVCGGLSLRALFPDSAASERSTRKIDRGIELPAATEPDFLQTMTQPQPTGFIGNLTKEEEQKLKEFWALLFQVLGVKDNPTEADNPTETDSPALDRASTTASTTPSSSDQKQSSKKRFGRFGKKNSNDKDGSEVSPVNTTTTTITTNGNSSAGNLAGLKLNDSDDKFGQNKEFYDVLANWTSEELRLAFWTQAKHDHPDSLLLRFLRARKWDVSKALAMLISTMSWKVKDFHLDDDIMKKGDSAALHDDVKADDANAKKNADDFVSLLKRGESVMHGKDKAGRPICYVRVRMHRIGEFSQAALERYTVYIMETSRFLLEKPVETAVSFFNSSFDIVKTGVVNSASGARFRYDKFRTVKYGKDTQILSLRLSTSLFMAKPWDCRTTRK